MADVAQQRRVTDVLDAIATTTQVSAALDRYDDRDHAIEVLEREVALQRKELVLELRWLLRPHSSLALAARGLRPHWG